MITKVMPVVALGLLAAFAAAKPNATDRNFVRTIAQGNRAEAQFGRLALKRGHSATLRDYGTHLVSDHGHIQDDLVKLAAARGISAPGYMTPMDQHLYARLDALRGKSFDAAFKTAIVKHHNHALMTYERELRKGQDAGIRAYAQKNLPMIRQHRDELRSIGA